MKKAFVMVLIICLSLFFSEMVLAKEDTTPSGISLTDLEDFIDDYVKDYIGETAAGAGIVVVKNNEIILSKGYGYADIQNHIAINPSTTVLEWGSISKLFVWVSVMQLVEQGKIDLNEDIKNYLPQGFLTKLTYDEPITMLNLMNHTAGFEDNVFDLGFASEDRVKSLEEGLKIAEPRQLYRPGEVVAYSNYSTSLAAYIVERKTGQKFYEYISNNVFSKLDIQHSTMHLPMEENLEITQNKAKGYELIEPTKFKISTPFHMSMYPSGGINGTTEDLAKIAMALMPEDNKESVLFEYDNTLNFWKIEDNDINGNHVNVVNISFQENTKNHLIIWSF